VISRATRVINGEGVEGRVSGKYGNVLAACSLRHERLLINYGSWKEDLALGTASIHRLQYTEYTVYIHFGNTL
jgi:hypothetical protein